LSENMQALHNFQALTLLASCSAGIVPKLYNRGTNCSVPYKEYPEYQFPNCLSKSAPLCLAYDDAMPAFPVGFGVNGKTLYIAYLNATHGYIKIGCTGTCSTCMSEDFFQFDACIPGVQLDWTLTAPTVKTLASSVEFSSTVCIQTQNVPHQHHQTTQTTILLSLVVLMNQASTTVTMGWTNVHTFQLGITSLVECTSIR